MEQGLMGWLLKSARGNVKNVSNEALHFDKKKIFFWRVFLVEEK